MTEPKANVRITIKTSDPKSIKPFLKNLYIPEVTSHKGQNGRLLIIGGSKLFHAATLWSAEVASHFVDIVHYSSTKENEKVFIALKTKFVNGIVVEKKNLKDYVQEDDCILVGPGMVRGKIGKVPRGSELDDILGIKDEPTLTYALTQALVKGFPDKKYVFDGGAVQMMKPQWLSKLSEKAIITPHAGEFARLFKTPVAHLSGTELHSLVSSIAHKYSTVVMLKAVSDVISDGKTTVEVVGGNVGLTKGGSGDTLAGLTAALNTKNDPLASAVISSYVVKRAAEELFREYSFWYNTSDLVRKIPSTFNKILV